MEWVDVDPVAHLTGHTQHPRADRGDEDRNIGMGHAPRGPLAVEQGERVVLAVEVELLDALEGPEDGSQGQHVFP